MAIEYEVVMKVRVDTDFFYWDLDTKARQDIISDSILNALYDIDDIHVSAVVAEELDTWTNRTHQRTIHSG